MVDGHLDDAAWERLATNEVSDLERDRYFDHVTSCAKCSVVWRGILELRKDAIAQGLIPAEASVRTGWQSRYLPLAIAATVLLAVGGLYINTRPASPPGTLRSVEGIAEIEGVMMAYNPEYVPTFVWPPVVSATQYRVEVFSEDGRPVWSRIQTAPPLPWPADVTTAKGTYRWRVEALKGDAVVARSRLTAMELTR